MGFGVVVALLGACGAEVDSSTSFTFDTAANTSPVTTSAVTTGPVANDLAGFARAEVLVGGETWTVAVADTPVLRSQGLMGVTDLVDVDGMLFVFDTEIQVSFYMLDTLIPLDIAFFASDGSLVDQFTMTPCDEVPCPTYPAAAPIRYAIEAAVGGFDGIEPLELRVTSNQ